DSRRRFRARRFLWRSIRRCGLRVRPRLCRRDRSEHGRGLPRHLQERLGDHGRRLHRRAVSAITGVIPQQTALPPSSSWPIPFAGPTNLSMANLVIGPEGGFAQREVSGCLTEAGVGNCAARWIYGPFVGAQVKYKITPNWSMRIKYDHMFYNASWTQ